MPSSSIYFDNHATTRCDPRVVDAMLPYFADLYGNSNSLAHAAGEAARDAVARARESTAAAIGASPSEIIFTSGATESNNLAIRGIAERRRRRGDHIITTAIEHPSVLDPVSRLARHGLQSTLIEVAPHGCTDAGRIDLDRLSAAMSDDTLLVSVMLANNEMGAIQPLAKVAALCRDRGIPLHSDATQVVGKLPLDVDELGVDLLSFSAHKMHGPKGVGALYVRRTPRGPRLEPLIVGGGQQAGRRAGTLNVPGIVGLATAVELCQHNMHDEWSRIGALRDKLAAQLLGTIGDCEICGPQLQAVTGGSQPQRLANNLNLLIGGIDAQLLVQQLPQIAMSSGAACSSASPEPSHVMRALGLSDDRVRSSLRIGLGRFNSDSEIPIAVAEIAAAVAELRSRRT